MFRLSKERKGYITCTTCAGVFSTCGMKVYTVENKQNVKFSLFITNSIADATDCKYCGCQLVLGDRQPKTEE